MAEPVGTEKIPLDHIDRAWLRCLRPLILLHPRSSFALNAGSPVADLRAVRDPRRAQKAPLRLHRHGLARVSELHEAPCVPQHSPSLQPGNRAKPYETLPPSTLPQTSRSLLSSKTLKTVQWGLLPEREGTFNQPRRTRKTPPFESKATHGSGFSSVEVGLMTLLCLKHRAQKDPVPY